MGYDDDRFRDPEMPPDEGFAPTDGDAEDFAPRPGLPWERREEVGPAMAVFGTIREVVFRPGMAFGAMRREGGWAEPLAFAVLIGSVGLWVAQAWDMVTRSFFAGISGLSVEEIAAANVNEIWFALIAPFLVVAATFFGSAIVHLLLLLLGGAPRPYETTFRVVSYSWAVGIFNLIPICGVVVGAVWRIVVQIIGVREAQGVPTGRAAAAVLIPLIFICLCLMMLFVSVIGMASLAGFGMQ